ncbi:DUF6461 domain-containing protein [Kitasatospora purpeofusca]|uniref:DUF6461 domain-containing protein n=1 Tax=Kitasatospora purpeofusca TaxID=67352 RepID=UPI00224FE3F6|nr:DUF6461 domain-containing protein [Kitasatospora purpeofusca]MCX4683448.1 DUF6461 domain-containing protein [Kitasatospora purpeofusca]
MSGLGWMYGADLPLVSVTFARDLTARELLERMGAAPATLAERTREEFREDFGDILHEDDAYVVTAGRYGSWAWAWEHGSWLCVDGDGLLGAVSAGTAALALHANEKPMVEFRYAENGRLVTGLNTLRGIGPEHRTGLDPDRFDSELRALGARPETGETGPLGLRGLFYRLAEGLGAGMERDDFLAGTVLSARLRLRPDLAA